MPRDYLAADVVRRVREAARHRCGYCLSPQHLVLGPLEIEHIIPRSRGGPNEEYNLWLSCAICNGHKSDRISGRDTESGAEVPLFNPREQRWSDHFRWSDDGLRIVGVTSIGRATVTTLHLADDPISLLVRSYWVQAGWHPPRDA
jgi:hypothetical protein